MNKTVKNSIMAVLAATLGLCASLAQAQAITNSVYVIDSRVAVATSIGAAIREPQPRTDTVPFIRVPYTMLIPPHPEWETRDDSLHHEGLQMFAQHLEGQMTVVHGQAADAAQRMTQLADKVRSGLLGVPLALRGVGRAGA